MASVSAVLFFAVAAALLYAVTVSLSKFLAVWPGAPSNFSSSPSDAFHEQPPPDLLQSLFEEASRTFWSVLLVTTGVVLALTFMTLLGVVCCAFIAVLHRFVFRPILDALSDADRSRKKTEHVMIPTMEMESV